MVYFMENPIRMDDFGVASSHGDGGSYTTDTLW